MNKGAVTFTSSSSVVAKDRHANRSGRGFGVQPQKLIGRDFPEEFKRGARPAGWLPNGIPGKCDCPPDFARDGISAAGLLEIARPDTLHAARRVESDVAVSTLVNPRTMR